MSKGGTTSGSTEIPAWLESAAIENINKARDVSQIGYVPYYGPDVAAFSPMQQQSMQSTGNAASAFGLAPQGFNAMAGMPQAQTFAGGLQGYSSAPLYEQSLDNLFANAPAQYRAMNNMFIDPFTGAAPRNAYNATPMQSSQMMSGGGGGGQAGFVDQAHADRMAQMSSTGRHYGVNSQYNPYAGSMMTDSSGALVDSNGDGVTDYRDMSFGEDGRRQIGDVEKYGNMLFGGIPRIIDGVQGSLFDLMGKGKVSEDPAYLAQQQQLMNDAAARGEAKYAREEADRIARQNQLGLDYIQRGDMYPSQILGSSDYQAYDGELALKEQEMAQARMLEDIRAAQEAEDFAAKNAAFVAKQEADLIKLNQLNNAVSPVVRTGGGNGGPKGNNDSWQGTNSSGTAKKGFSFGL
jgi:hypothetical protein